MAEKEVYFWQYCLKCKHRTEPEDDGICNACLTLGWNEDSHKPVEFVEDTTKKETK